MTKHKRICGVGLVFAAVFLAASGLAPACVCRAESPSAESGEDAKAAYKAAMEEGKQAEKKKQWTVALEAYRRALDAKSGDQAAKKAVEKVEKIVGVLPRGFEAGFEIPAADSDQYGNPVNTRNGRRADPAACLPFEIWCKDPRIEFVLAGAGTFQMGSPESEAGRNRNEGPVHKVVIPKPFYIAKYEITQAQWFAVMGDRPSRFKDAGDGFPVENVSWSDCRKFCEKKGFALPTEARWEYACRAGTQTPFYLGKTVTVDQVNYHGDYPYGGSPKGVNRQKTVRVGSFPPNAWGMYDTHGNVWEWCEDVYSADAYSKPEASKPDPVCASGSTLRIYRGGSWIGYAWYCRSANRDGQETEFIGGFIGLRPVKNIPD